MFNTPMIRISKKIRGVHMIKTVTITGYKAHELGIFNQKHPGIKIIKKALRNQLIPLIEEGLEWVIISGQLGIELWAAELVIELREDYPNLQLAVITPFLEQEKNWQDQRQEEYQSILAQADYVNSITNREYEGPWQFRAKNNFLLDHSDALLIIYDEEKEGSPKYIMKEAMERAEIEGYTYIRITAFDLQLIADEESIEENEID